MRELFSRWYLDLDLFANGNLTQILQYHDVEYIVHMLQFSKQPRQTCLSDGS